MDIVVRTGDHVHVMTHEESVALTVPHYPELSVRIRPTAKGGVAVEIEDRKTMDNIVENAYNELMKHLFGSVPANPQDEKVERYEYTEAMLKVQRKYGLEQGHPDFLEWILTLIGRSPVLTHEGKIVYEHSTDAGPEQTQTMG